MEQTDNQAKNKVEYIRPYQWKKGQSGNIMGRPKGKTMKEYVKQYLERMTDEERDEWLEGIPKEKIWEMAESKASQGIGQAEDLGKLDLGVVVLPMKNESTLETTTETGTSSSE
jgi:hypothetical protein